MKYALEREIPKVVKGLSSMQFTVKGWDEVALSDDMDALLEYAKTFPKQIKLRLIDRYTQEVAI